MEKGYEMDLSEATKAILRRIQMIEPELAPKMIEYLLLKVYGDQEVIRLAFGPDLALWPLISEAKAALSGRRFSVPVNGAPEVHPHVGSYPPTGSADSSCSMPPGPSAPPCWDPQCAPEFQRALPNLDPNQGFPSGEGNPAHSGKLMCCSYFREHPANGHPKAGSTRRTKSLAERSPRVCHYYQKGYCKHGANCRYIHGGLTPNARELGGEDRVISSGSLEALEVEIVNLLRSRKGQTISISVLPTMYSNMYGKPLEADGYLTESQRHGKPGYNLTTLLARLKNIRIVDRPHGQHSVMLAEDAQKCVDLMSAGNDSSSNVSGSQRIYLTFPSDSSFNEDDVANYFRRYGRVLDVRIPAQHKRMFGFVTFESQEAVKLILSKPNTHYVCGFRVLAKPYKEKSTINDRRKFDKSEPLASHFWCLNSDSHVYSTKRFYENSPRWFKEHFHDKNVKEFEISLRGISPTSLGQQPLFEWDEEHMRCQVQEEFSHLPGLVNDVNNDFTREEIHQVFAQGESSNFTSLVDDLTTGSHSNDGYKIFGTNNGHQSFFAWDVEEFRFQAQGESSDVAGLTSDMNNESVDNNMYQIFGTNNGHQSFFWWDVKQFNFQTEGESIDIRGQANDLNNGSSKNDKASHLGQQ